MLEKTKHTVILKSSYLWPVSSVVVNILTTTLLAQQRFFSGKSVSMYEVAIVRISSISRSRLVYVLSLGEVNKPTTRILETRTTSYILKDFSEKNLC